MGMDSQSVESTLQYVSPQRAAALLEDDYTARRKQTDRLIGVLLVLQWIGLAVFVWAAGPRGSGMVPALRLALLLGGLVSIVPSVLAFVLPGQALSRHALCVGLTLSALLTLHATAGRPHSLFPIYAAFALSALYLDRRMFLTAWAAVIAGCVLPRLFWPTALFGAAPVLRQQWIEPAVWLLLETGALLYCIAWCAAERMAHAERESQCETLEGRLRRTNAEMEKQIQERVAELKHANALLEQQIAESARVEEKLQWQAHHDALTGLPNRTLFLDRLDQAIAMASRSEKQAAVLFVDLDRFKQVNDNLGHGMGDKLLLEVADRLKASLRTEDTIARLGGDEFTILLPSLPNAKDAAKVARKILEALGRPVYLADQEMFFSASIGISLFPDDGDDAEKLIKVAGIAMQRTKEQGRGGYQHYAEKMNATTVERFALESNLRKALANRELILYYQAQVDAKSGRVPSVETLVRWRHPEMGLVPPGTFISLAEETGLILPMGEWILRTAARQAAEWNRAGTPIRTSVNLSARQFEQRDLIHMVGYILRETGLPPDLLELELTESCIMDKGDGAVKTLAALKDLGVRLAIDDFGTGYSSLAYLRRFPMDVLKIDRSFVRGLEHDEVDVAIVRAVSDLAHAVGLEVVAEGVETDGQQEILRQLHCDLIQGYLYSPPVPVAEFEQLASSRNGAPPVLTIVGPAGEEMRTKSA